MSILNLKKSENEIINVETYKISISETFSSINLCTSFMSLYEKRVTKNKKEMNTYPHLIKSDYPPPPLGEA